MSGTPAEIGLAGAAAFLAGQEWKDFDILFVDAGHFVFISPSVGNDHPMLFVYQGVSRQIHWKAVNAKAKDISQSTKCCSCKCCQGLFRTVGSEQKKFPETLASPKQKEGEKRPGGATGSTPDSKVTRSG